MLSSDEGHSWLATLRCNKLRPDLTHPIRCGQNNIDFFGRPALRPLTIFLALMSLATPALGAEPNVIGLWLREDGTAHVRFGSCGEAVCGYVAWVQDPANADDIGLKVFYDMMPGDAGEWKGSAFNPEDRKTYSGKMLLEGAALKTSGCIFGGLICKSVNWTRLK